MAAMKTDTPRLPKPTPTPNGDPTFTLTFTKQEADILASLLDACVKAYGIQALDASQLWLAKVRTAMQPPS